MEPIYGQSWVAMISTAAMAALAYFLAKLVQHRRSFKGLPMPPHDFLWGHLKLMGEIVALFPNNAHYQVYITTISRKYDLPGLWYLDLWPMGPKQIIITDPDLAHHTTSIENHPKHEAEHEFLDPILGNRNIVSSNGQAWKYLHNMLAPPFAVASVRNMVGMISQEVMVFRSILNKLAKTGEVFSLETAVSRMAFDVVSTATFGSSLNSQTKGSAAIRDFNEMCSAFSYQKRGWNPLKTIASIIRRWFASRRLDAELNRRIRDRFEILKRDNVDVSQKRGLSIVDLILREHINEGKTLDSEFMNTALSNIKTMLLAGTGTTSDTLSFLFMLVQIHPEVVDRMREEHDRVFTPGIEATYAMLQDNPQKLSELEYTTNVIKETLRFFPIGNTARAERPSGFFTHKGQQYSTKGFMLCPVQHTMHLDPRVFPNPQAFDPDRFKREDFPRNAWRPFERGPRACLGQSFAMDEMRITLLLTVREFDLTCANLKPNKEPRVEWNQLDTVFGDRAFQEFIFEAKPRDGMAMTVKKRTIGTN
ncbi:cytochrome P450 [Clohesyomyces aquaticus]|uniref:Cytochrome P450 n=1 Tax=Clohesyomyces aquaticus TaxID=1231657 RepID=A0A1Y1Z627_9PLEO|nr:cytochrome P450 [Clohesyomyces aquaticus]